MPKKVTKVLTRRKKFQEVDVPLSKAKIELIGNTPEEIEGKTIKLDLTRQLKGKSVEATVKIKQENGKLVANPVKIKLMPYFIRRMIRKRISYVEDSFETPSQDSILKVKPFLITRKRVSRAVRKTLRNKAKNWLEDYIAEKKDNELFNEILLNRIQKPLSLVLKKTYPLSLCEIRLLEIKRPLKPEEVPEIKEKKFEGVEESVEFKEKPKIEEGLDQLSEIEEEIKKQKVKDAQEDIKKAQDKASEKEKNNSEGDEEDKNISNLQNKSEGGSSKASKDNLDSVENTNEKDGEDSRVSEQDKPLKTKKDSKKETKE